MTDTINHLDPVLNSPDLGLALAYRVRDRLNAGHNVVIDLTGVERMTPSYANAFVMAVLEYLREDSLEPRVSFVNGEDIVMDAIYRSVARYGKGIRLSNQPKIALG
jgi:hypothetical protein